MQMTFSDLKGLRAEAYIRDSTLDQKDGYGPDLQRKTLDTFANTWGLNLGNAYYTDFITGTSTIKRSGLKQALSDAHNNTFDVLLVYHTSRFARNRADAIRCKAELKKLGKTVVFVSQGIISGNDNDFLNEGINEILDEQYSRNLSRFVADGLKIKHEQGIANGVPPLGYKSEKLDNGKRERKVPDLIGIGGDPKLGGMEALRTLLQSYVNGDHSYQTLADYLNAQGYRNRVGKLFTKGSVEHVLSNRFYEGKAVYHSGESDEEVVEGTHAVPNDIKELWQKCQNWKIKRTAHRQGRPRSEQRAYPFSKIAVCSQCGRHYGGQPVYRKNGGVIRRLYHSRPFCQIEPHSVRVENIMDQFSIQVLPYLTLDKKWKDCIMGALNQDNPSAKGDIDATRLERVLENLRKQHLWGDISDQEYRQSKQDLERQRQALTPLDKVVGLNIDRAADLLNGLPSLWAHPGVTDKQRENLVRELFEEVQFCGSELVEVAPKLDYKPLFACIIMNGVRKCRGEWIRTTDLSVPNAAR